MRTELVAVVSDWHVPYHDSIALRYALRYLQSATPHILYLNGDIIDCYQLSQYDKDPNRALDLHKDLHATRTLLQEWRNGLPNTRFVFLMGNHEQRVEKYLRRQATALYNLPDVRIESLLRLHEYDIFFPRNKDGSFPEMWFHRKQFIITHGHISRKRSGYAAHEMMLQTWCSGVMGHTHKLALVHTRKPDGRQHEWAEIGCLCQLHMDYCATPDWQQGFALIEFSRHHHQIHLVSVPAIKAHSTAIEENSHAQIEPYPEPQDT